MSIEILNLLKEEVERVFGRKILTASDCQNLSKDIYQQTKSGLSLNTLRRNISLLHLRWIYFLNTVAFLLFKIFSP